MKPAIFKQLYRQCFPKVAYMVKALGGNQLEAEDIFQESLVILYEKVMQEDLQLRTNPQAYLLDNCIDVFKEDGNMERRCDGVLNYSNNIIFIELKSVRTGGWIKDGVEQLEITVERYFSDKNIRDYGKKRAVLANSKRPFFHYGQQSRMEDFRMKTGVRLIINSKILIR
jgi:hypothetical protein